jgi:hypothetical protein
VSAIDASAQIARGSHLRPARRLVRRAQTPDIDPTAGSHCPPLPLRTTSRTVVHRRGGSAPRLPHVVHSTSAAPAPQRARVASGAEEPLLAHRVRSSKDRRHGACAASRRRRARAQFRRLSRRLRERLNSPARTSRCRRSCIPQARRRRYGLPALVAEQKNRYWLVVSDRANVDVTTRIQVDADEGRA